MPEDQAAWLEQLRAGDESTVRDMVRAYGADTTRLFCLFAAPLALLAVYHFVFTTVFKAGSFGRASFLLFVAVALWPWLANGS